MPAWIQDGFHEYARRMPPEVRVELVELKPEERGAGKNEARAKAVEGERLLAAVPGGRTPLPLDQRGKAGTPKGGCRMLGGWSGDPTHPGVAIVGATRR